MNFEVNWLAVIVAALSSMAVGFVWYAKPVFGEKWAKLAGLKLNDDKMKANSGKAIGLALVMSFLTALTVAHVAALFKFYYDVGTLQAGLMTAFWLWLGISTTTVVVHDVFEQRPIKLTLLTVGNQLVTLVAMGLIVGLFGGF
jgi:hypothetical protein